MHQTGSPKLLISNGFSVEGLQNYLKLYHNPFLGVSCSEGGGRRVAVEGHR